jgi:cardiolipin synthase
MLESLIATHYLGSYTNTTEKVDGWIARTFNQKTVLGSILDPLADKTLMIALTATLTYTQYVPIPLAIVILGKDVCLVIASFYFRWKSLPRPVKDLHIPLLRKWINSSCYRFSLICDLPSPLSIALSSYKKRTMLRFWDPTLSTVEVRPTLISKVNTGLQFGLLSVTLLDNSFVPFVSSSAYDVMWWTIGVTTIASGASYIGSKSSLKYFHRWR